ncbi:regulatory helix-turn-helix protein, lysR family [Hymenobacter psychrotolerans DSM 18569]|uniref:Regulatory helix-turn-helix protein, lysR family n=1 Tax=Hymenobacter psychrotolerans DSM 18569 TaxID=1121959 RepID=A0A1M7HSV9_9BACT|nr:regulatory helix-turn-helix protein, lysR family [Hymenobacter psychrotolerans DSM 18569]
MYYHLLCSKPSRARTFTALLSHPHEIFLEVARQLSFTKAAQTLFLSQSAVSKQVKALEEHYKTGLFERLGNSIQLTPAGEPLYRKLLLARQLQHELHQEFTELSPTFSPQVHMVIGASTTISLYVIPPVLSAYLGPLPAYPVHAQKPQLREYSEGPAGT